jgi:hypothetical protein
MSSEPNIDERLLALAASLHAAWEHADPELRAELEQLIRAQVRREPKFRAALQRIAALHWLAPWEPPIPGLRQVLGHYISRQPSPPTIHCSGLPARSAPAAGSRPATSTCTASWRWPPRKKPRRRWRPSRRSVAVRRRGRAAATRADRMARSVVCGDTCFDDFSRRISLASTTASTILSTSIWSRS